MPANNPTRIGDIYQLKVTLKEVEPAVWRRLEVPAEIKLSRLHVALQLAMGWQNYHLHEFRIGEAVYGEPSPEFDDERRVMDDRRVALSRAVASVGTPLTYLYDFGDGWTHEIVVEDVHPAVPRIRYPRITDGARACPPEDVGGPWSYTEFLEAIGDPRHEQHEEMVEWIGFAFDPAYFDVDATNRAFDAAF
jgi:hypothetical protein